MTDPLTDAARREVNAALTILREDKTAAAMRRIESKLDAAEQREKEREAKGKVDPPAPTPPTPPAPPTPPPAPAPKPADPPTDPPTDPPSTKRKSAWWGEVD